MSFEILKEYDKSYFSDVAPGIRILARRIFYIPSYSKKAGTAYVLELITSFSITYSSPFLKTNKG